MNPLRNLTVQSTLLIVALDRPFTDLHNTEGEGGYPGPNFFARPVVGGHYAFLALERACGGQAMQALAFLDEESSTATPKGHSVIPAEDEAAMKSVEL